MLCRLNDLRVEQAAKDEDGRVRCGCTHGKRLFKRGGRKPVDIGRGILSAYAQAVAGGIGFHDLHDAAVRPDERA